jgi:NhaP-type Na+/H+ and K+/H+ antiporter
MMIKILYIVTLIAFLRGTVPRGTVVANYDMFSYMYVRLHVIWVLLFSGFNTNLNFRRQGLVKTPD